MPPVVDLNICIACGTCVDVCTEDVFFESKRFGMETDEHPVVTHPEVCYHCNLCVLECSSGAIRLMTPMAMTVSYK